MPIKVAISNARLWAWGLVVAVGLGMATPGLAEECSGGLDCQRRPCDKVEVGKVCWVPVDELHPTQFAVGMVDVACKARKLDGKKKKIKSRLETIENLYKINDIREWGIEAECKLGDKSAAETKIPDDVNELSCPGLPVVRTPDGMFLVDGHHRATGTYQALKRGGFKDDELKHIKARLIYDYTNDPKLKEIAASNGDATGYITDDMWKRGWLYPFDQHGKEVPSPLGKLADMDLCDLEDDPMRTLSKWVREECGYKKNDPETGNLCGTVANQRYFVEFLWAEYLRKELSEYRVPSAEYDGCKNDHVDREQIVELLRMYQPATILVRNEPKVNQFFSSGNEKIDPLDIGFACCNGSCKGLVRVDIDEKGCSEQAKPE